MNELHYNAYFINGSGYVAGANLNMIRLGDEGIPYNSSIINTTTNNTKTLDYSLLMIAFVLLLTTKLLTKSKKLKRFEN